VKAAALGMSHGTAANKLRKMILFSLVCRLNLNMCYRCDGEILSVDDLSIEHKEAWMQADDLIQSFFDLGNIAFSHLSCNSAAGERPHKKYFSKEERHSRDKEISKNYWHSLGKEEQRKRRRVNYLRNSS